MTKKSQDANLTIGGSLAALQHAYQTNSKLIINKMLFPFPFEPSWVKQTWGLIYYKLMMDGKMVGGDNVNGIKIDDQKVFVVCKGNVVNEVYFDNLTVFNDENVVGLPDIKKEVNENTILDIMKPHSFVFLENVYDYKSKDRLVSGLHVRKEKTNLPINIWAVSNLSTKDLQDFNFSDTMVKFKSEEILKQAGYTGKSHNRDEVILEVVSREVIPQMNIYEDTEKIKFIYE
jgi:hypothetical protein